MDEDNVIKLLAAIAVLIKQNQIQSHEIDELMDKENKNEGEKYDGQKGQRFGGANK